MTPYAEGGNQDGQKIDRHLAIRPSTHTKRAAASASFLPQKSNVIRTCYEAYGTSYLVQWAGDNFRVQKVTGDSLIPSNKPIKGSTVAGRPTTKLIQADWPWHGNRDQKNSQTQWHRGARRSFNV